MCLASKPYPNFLRGRRYQPYTRARQGSLIQPILSYLPATVMISTTPKQTPTFDTKKFDHRISTERNTNVLFLHSDEVILGSVPGILPIYIVNWYYLRYQT